MEQIQLACFYLQSQFCVQPNTLKSLRARLQTFINPLTSETRGQAESFPQALPGEENSASQPFPHIWQKLHHGSIEKCTLNPNHFQIKLPSTLPGNSVIDN